MLACGYIVKGYSAGVIGVYVSYYPADSADDNRVIAAGIHDGVSVKGEKIEPFVYVLYYIYHEESAFTLVVEASATVVQENLQHHVP